MAMYCGIQTGTINYSTGLGVPLTLRVQKKNPFYEQCWCQFLRICLSYIDFCSPNFHAFKIFCFIIFFYHCICFTTSEFLCIFIYSYILYSFNEYILCRRYSDRLWRNRLKVKKGLDTEGSSFPMGKIYPFVVFTKCRQILHRNKKKCHFCTSKLFKY